MAKPTKVSVILTSYNHAKYLRGAIDSILNQTYSDFALIIWDDGSIDESWQIINNYSDPRIRAFRNETGQHGAPIRSVMSKVEIGEYIAIHHSDDLWEPQKLEKQLVFLEENSQIGAVFSNAFIIGENGEPVEDTSHFYYKIFEQPNRTRYEWLNYFFYNGNALCHPSLLIRKICYDDCGLYRYGLAQLADFDMWVRLCLKYEIYVMPEKLVRFRVRTDEMNSSSDRPETRIRWQFEFFQIINNYRAIKTLEELIKVFPSAQNYFAKGGFDIGFVLGMVALEPKTQTPVKLFGLSLLFEALNDSDRARKISELYNFNNSDFIALTAKDDVFSIELIASMAAQAAERDGHIAALGGDISTLQGDISTLSTTISDIYSSRSWRLSSPLRWLGRQSRRALRLFNMLPAQFLRVGGIFPFIRNIVRTWNQDGLTGIKALAHRQYTEENIAEPPVLPAALPPELDVVQKPARPEILFVSHEASRTGAPIFLLNLIRFLFGRLNVDFVILLCTGGELEHEFRSLATTITLTDREKLDPLVLHALKKRNIKLVYSNTITNGMIQMRLKELGCPILCHVHELAFSIETYFGKESIKRVLDTTTLFLAGSGAVATNLSKQLHLPPERIVLAYPFIATQENLRTVQDAPRPLDLPKNAVVIGACGSVSWRKGTDLFIQVARLVLAKTSTPVVFVWLGGPLSYGDYRNLHYDAVLMGIDHDIIFTGNVTSHLPYFAQFDIFVLPSREDPFPLVALDAGSIGIPIVCFDRAGGTPELVEEDAGVVVPYLDIEHMAEAIKRLVEDNTLRKQMGKRAHQKVIERHDIIVGGERIAEIIQAYL